MIGASRRRPTAARMSLQFGDAIAVRQVSEDLNMDVMWLGKKVPPLQVVLRKHRLPAATLSLCLSITYDYLLAESERIEHSL